MVDGDVRAAGVDGGHAPGRPRIEADDGPVAEVQRGRLGLRAGADHAARVHGAALDGQRQRGRSRVLVEPVDHARPEGDRHAGRRRDRHEGDAAPDRLPPHHQPVKRIDATRAQLRRHLPERLARDLRHLDGARIEVAVAVLVFAAGQDAHRTVVTPGRGAAHGCLRGAGASGRGRRLICPSSLSTSCETRVEARRRTRLTVASESSIASAISSNVIPSTCRSTRTRRSRVFRRSSSDVEPPERVAALGVDDHDLLVGDLAGLRQGQPAPRAPPAQLPLHDADGERDDEAAQRLGFPERADARKQPVEDLLGDVFDLGVGAQRPADDPVHQRRVAVPGHLSRVRLAGMSACASSRSRAASASSMGAVATMHAEVGGDRPASREVSYSTVTGRSHEIGTDTLRLHGGPRKRAVSVKTMLLLRSRTYGRRWPATDWSYDRRLKCVASSIPLARETDARAAMADALPASFSAETVAGGVGWRAGADRKVRRAARVAAAVLGRQRQDDAPGAFGLWWPWGDGTTVSLRIGLHDVDFPKSAILACATCSGFRRCLVGS